LENGNLATAEKVKAVNVNLKKLHGCNAKKEKIINCLKAIYSERFSSTVYSRIALGRARSLGTRV